MDEQDREIKAILEREFSVTVIDVQTQRESGETTCAKFGLAGGRILTVCADWDVASTVHSVAEELAKKSRESPERKNASGVDLNQEIWDALRAAGHSISEVYIQDGSGLMVVVDGVAMSVKDARAVADKRVTIAEVAAARTETR